MYGSCRAVRLFSIRNILYTERRLRTTEPVPKTFNTFLNCAQKINLVSNFQSVNKLDSDHSQEFLRGIFLFGYKCFCIDLSYLCFVINLVSVVRKYEKMIKENFGLRQIRLASGAGED